MNSRPEVTDEEIKSSMNFDGLLIRHKESVKFQHRKVVRNISFAVTSVVLMAALWFVTRESQTETPVLKGNVVKPDKALTPVQPNDSVEHNESEIGTDNSTVRQVPSFKKKREYKAPSPEEKTKDEVDASPLAFTQAEPKEGYPKLYEYFSRALTYPKEALPDSVTGIVTVIFSINKTGRPENISIEQSLGKSFDAEAVRLIENMPEWNPATYNGKPVSSRVSLPITFQIKNLKSVSHE